MQDRRNGGIPAKLASGPKIGYDLARVGAGLGRGPGYQKKAVAAAWSGTWPAPGATLDLDFANDRGFVRGVGQGSSMQAVTFTRASNGTFVGPDGLQAGSGGNQGALGLNLLSFPQDFDNAFWAKQNTTVIANAALAPNGTLTADKLVETQTTTTHVLRADPVTTTGTAAVFSLRAQKAERSFVKITINNAANTTVGAWFDLNAGTVGTTDAGVTATISALSDGWFLLSVSCTAFNGANNGRIFIGSANNVETYTGDGTSGIFIWGAQLEVGSTATTYYPTNINTPRFDWASTATVANTARKNLIQYSDSLTLFGNRSVNVTAGQTDPFGGTNATLTVASTIFDVHTRTYSVLDLVPGQIYTTSIYLKGANIGKVSVGFTVAGAGLNGASNIDLIAGVIAGAFGGFTNQTLTSVGGGYYRFSFTFTAVQSSLVWAIYVTDNSYSGSWTGDGTSGFYGFGAQLEVGSSVTAYESEGVTTPITPLAANPTCNGLLVEEARTNRILWCRDATQTNWTKSNCTVAKDQTGIDGVANAATSLTATNANATCIQTITLASGSRTGSVYLKRITGTGVVQVTLDGTTYSTVTLTSDYRRMVLSGTVTNPVVGIRIATSGDAVAMDYAQVEDGNKETTPILTTTATATRGGDVATISEVLFDRAANHGEMSFKATFNRRGGSGQRHVFNYNHQNDTGLLLWNGSGASDPPFITWGVQTGSPILRFSDYVEGTEVTVAGSYKWTNASFAKAGATQTINREITIGNTGINKTLRLSIGCQFAQGAQLNGTIKQLVINPFDLNESQTAELSR